MIANKEYRLQLLHNETLFPTSKDAKAYVTRNFAPEALMAEPAIVFYGDNIDEANAIIALGDGSNGVIFIDVNGLGSQLSEVEDKIAAGEAEFTKINEVIQNIITACGLKYDDNKIHDKVTYDDVKDKNDVLLRNASNILESISILSTEIQKVKPATVESTKSIKMTCEDNVIKAKVKVSKTGSNDSVAVNDNILGVYDDGLYAAVDLRFDEDSNSLVFVASGVKDGEFKTDAKIQKVVLPSALNIVANNKNGSPVVVKVKKDEEGNVNVSANLKLSEAEDNILEVQDGTLYVQGTAKNIKYKKSNVFQAVNSLESEVDSITIDVDAALNTITLTVGDKTVTKQLPGVDVIQDASYDKANKNIIIVFKNGNKLTIPVGDLINTYQFETNHTIELHAHTQEDGTIGVYGKLKIRPTDNILSVDEQGYLFVPKGATATAEAIEELGNQLAEEIKRATDKERELEKAIQKETDDRKDADIVLDGKITQESHDRELADSTLKSDLEGAINNEKERAVAKETEIEKSLQQEIADRQSGDATNASAIETETNRAKSEELRIETLAQGAVDSVSAITTRVDELSRKDVELATAISSEETRAKLAEQGLEKQIGDEVARATGVENAIAQNLSNEINTARNNEASLESKITKTQEDLGVVSTSASNLRTDLTAEIGRAKGEEKRIEDLVKAAQSAADANTTNIFSLTAEVHSNTDAINNEVVARTKDVERLDQKIDNVSEKVSNLESNITSTTETTLATAKAYTDAETTRAKGEEEKLQSSIDGLTAKDNELKAEIDGKVGSVELIKSGEQKYTFRVDGSEIGDIDIPKDQFLKDARYDAANHKLILTVILNDEGQKDLEVDLVGLVDTYKSGDGLKLTDDGTFSIQISEGNEGYLSVGEGGIKITGINEALNQKADKTELDNYYTKEETDGKYLTEHQSLEAYATKTEVESVDGKVETLKTTVDANSVALGIINSGNPVQEGSLAYVLAEATSLVNAEAQTRKEKDDELKSEIDSKANASDVYDKTYIDGKDFASKSDLINLATSEMVSAVERKVDANTTALDTKANITDVYSKTEANAEFLSQKDAEYTYATQSKVSDVEDKADANTKSIEDLAKVVEGEKFTVETSDTVELFMSDGKVLKSNLRISNELGNALKANGTGAYVNVSLDYNAADNTLIFSDGNGTTNLKLSGGSVIKSARYESSEKKLIFTFEVGEDVVIPVSDLFNQLEVVNPTNDPVQLDIVRGAGSQGGDTIQATLRISTVDGNLIEKENGTLFASNKAEKHTAIIHGDTVTVQKALDDAITGVESLDTRTTALEGRVTTIESEIVDLKAKDIAHDESLTDLKTRMATAEANIVTCQNDITILQGEVASIKASIQELSDTINGTGDGTSLADRIATLEEICNSLIDFGTYRN